MENDTVVSVNKIINTDKDDEEEKAVLVNAAKDELAGIEQGNIFDISSNEDISETVEETEE